MTHLDQASCGRWQDSMGVYVLPDRSGRFQSSQKNDIADVFEWNLHLMEVGGDLQCLERWSGWGALLPAAPVCRGCLGARSAGLVGVL